MLQEKIGILKSWIDDSSNIIFFGGAGVSTESHIPDFRSIEGIYNMTYKYSPEMILSHSFFMERTEAFYEFYRAKMIYTEAEPNITHNWLAIMEEKGKLKGVITQNIDGLHQKAGSRKVLELHGSIYRNYCMKCDRFYSMEDILHSEGIPRCSCGGIIKPDVVLYEESLDEQVVSEAINLLSHADILIIGGTSLRVYPAAGLVRYYKGSRMVLVNKTTTEQDETVDLLIQAGLGEVFSFS